MVSCVNPPRGATGSNQYVSKGSSTASRKAPGPARVVAAAVLAEDDTEAIAWAFHPERTRWSAAGIDSFEDYQSWTADGGTLQEAEAWHQGWGRAFDQWDTAPEGSMFLWAVDDETQSQEIMVSSNPDDGRTALADLVREQWNGEKEPAPRDWRLAVHRYLHNDDTLALDARVVWTGSSWTEGVVSVISSLSHVSVRVHSSTEEASEFLVSHVHDCDDGEVVDRSLPKEDQIAAYAEDSGDVLRVASIPFGERVRLTAPG